MKNKLAPYLTNDRSRHAPSDPINYVIDLQTVDQKQTWGQHLVVSGSMLFNTEEKSIPIE